MLQLVNLILQKLDKNKLGLSDGTYSVLEAVKKI